MAAYSEMQPAGARDNEEKRGETEIWGGDILDTFWWQTFGSRGWSGLKLKDWLIRHSSWKLAPFFPSTVMSQTPTRCTLYLHQKSPPAARFYNQFANLKRNFLIDFSIQKLSVGIGDFHLKPSILEIIPEIH